MKTNTLKIDFNTNTLIMDRTFAKAAAFVGSEEYNILQNARRDYPTFIVATRSIKKNPNKESYKGLTYEYMESYIASHNENKMKEYEEMRLLAKCHSIRYPHIKKWFLATFPEVEKFSLETDKIESELSVVKGDNGSSDLTAA